MASAQDVQSVATLLQSSLDPAIAKQSELSLRAAETQPGFSILLLQIVASNDFLQTTRLAGALFFKNFIRRKWRDEEGNYLIPVGDVNAVKSEIVGLMITLPPSLQVQLGEAISIMADSDFPDRWPNLVDDLVSRLSPNDVAVNNGVLLVAHSIFKRWRPLFRSDALFMEIKLVLDKFCVPFMTLFQRTDELIAENQNNKAVLEQLFQTLLLIIKIYFDLNCQDIPEFFEDHIDALMGLVHKYLRYSNPLIETDDDDETGPLEQVKASICELIQLYSQRYEEVFGALLPSFVDTTWTLLTTTGLQPKYDLLISRALSFLTTVTKSRDRAQVFSSSDVLQQIVEKIVLPNMTLRTSDEELFEDDPIEYTRRDLEGSDSDTRRRAATDFLRELKERFEGLVTDVVMSYVQRYLQQYSANRNVNWRLKDTAVYLFSSVAVKGTITASGVSATNMLLDVVGFFSQNIAPDLVEPSTLPILKVDAIKFIHTFRNQLTKQQLLEAFPVLSNMFLSPEYVVYTYAAITIERILSIRQPSSSHLLFDKEDVAPVAQELLINLFGLIEKGNTPEKLAENEFLMKCVMRVLMTSKDSIVPYSDTLIQHLAGIVMETSKNPSNPKFSHYTFESLAIVIRFASQAKPEAFDGILFPVYINILGQDITEFVPYVFQLLSQMLDVSPQPTLPDAYTQLIQPILSVSLWDARGNVPALTRLLQSILAKSPTIFGSMNLLEALLGVFQKLLSSRVNDHLGLDLLESIFYYIPKDQISRYTSPIANIILVRLEKSRTEKLVLRVTHLIYFLASAPAPADKLLGPNFAAELFDVAQNALFGDIFEHFVLAATPKLHSPLDRKLAMVGLTKILFESSAFLQKYSSRWETGARVLLTTLQSNSLVDVFEVADELPEADEELSFGASFVKLNAVVWRGLDPASDVTDMKKFVGETVTKAGNAVIAQVGDVSDEVKSGLAALAV
ncbi:Cse1-domain-containing protein [Lipomyces tetrasporus]|uniref:Cse1-domain-containing protein n=1 Tax=Lipomyces tetrasporus TaxID=54092 RepID=A0AAD7VRE1_9ASCO|nr:Cse1-domain-containing protein [Lipomyces tetrasporus]KAJ8099083.1 Cse1-domain-containing protein [Lipomyces tetrasporus]